MISRWSDAVACCAQCRSPRDGGPPGGRLPQGRGRGPIVKERIVSESVAPAPVVGERVVTQPAVADYTVGTRVRDAYALAPMPQAVVATVPNVRSYRYMVINNRLLLVDPATGYVVADMTE